MLSELFLPDKILLVKVSTKDLHTNPYQLLHLHPSFRMVLPTFLQETVTWDKVERSWLIVPTYRKAGSGQLRGRTGLTDVDSLLNVYEWYTPSYTVITRNLVLLLCSGLFCRVRVTSVTTVDSVTGVTVRYRARTSTLSSDSERQRTAVVFTPYMNDTGRTEFRQ
ncbi:hypothetical protein K439DRAFT_1625425 [Ramaria rubella]|nr:hypothetical protein K439DRAFT_1625425 [Ramaria rubella]